MNFKSQIPTRIKKVLVTLKKKTFAIGVICEEELGKKGGLFIIPSSLKKADF